MMRVYHQWTAKERDFVRLHHGSLSPEPWPRREIVAALGVSVNQLRGAVRRWGLGHPGRFRAMTWARMVTAVRLYEAGACDGAIARELGCHRHTVRRWRKRTGRPRKRGRPFRAEVVP